MRGRLASTLLAFVVLLGGCIAHPWQVIRQAVPNPLVGKTIFEVAPTSFEGLRVGGVPEGEWLAGKDGQQRQSWEGDKAGMANEFLAALQRGAAGIGIRPAGPGAAGLVIVPHVTFVEPGFYVGVAHRSSEAQMLVQIREGQTLIDEISVGAMVPADLSNPSTGGRLRAAAQRIGVITAAYLRSRVFP